MLRAFTLAALLCTTLLLLTPAAAAERGRREQKPLLTDPILVPSANASPGLSQNILSGVDFTCIAPPDSRIRVIEDEPYIYSSGLRCKDRLPLDWAHSSITLRSDLGGGGWYECTLTLLWQPRGQATQLLRDFDSAANEAYQRSALARETRDSSAYGLYEVRSKLGIALPDRRNSAVREFLAYSAAVANPLNQAPLPGSTPYDYVSGKLMVVPPLRASNMLLTIEFDARAFPYSLRLTENIARCIANRLYAEDRSKKELAILDYAPEYELPTLQYDSAGRLLPVDPRTADLVEQPAEGCGPQQYAPGGVMPDCPAEPRHWPARPYGEFTDALGSYCEDACVELNTAPPRTIPSLASLATGWELPASDLALTGPPAPASATPPASGWEVKGTAEAQTDALHHEADGTEHAESDPKAQPSSAH